MYPMYIFTCIKIRHCYCNQHLRRGKYLSCWTLPFPIHFFIPKSYLEVSPGILEVTMIFRCFIQERQQTSKDTQKITFSTLWFIDSLPPASAVEVLESVLSVWVYWACIVHLHNGTELPCGPPNCIMSCDVMEVGWAKGLWNARCRRCMNAAVFSLFITHYHGYWFLAVNYHIFFKVGIWPITPATQAAIKSISRDGVIKWEKLILNSLTLRYQMVSLGHKPILPHENPEISENKEKNTSRYTPILPIDRNFSRQKLMAPRRKPLMS